MKLTDLTAEQIRALARLDDGFEPEDSVGRETNDLRPIDSAAVGSLLMLGLATADEGHTGQVWVRLTDKGRKVRETGEA